MQIWGVGWRKIGGGPGIGGGICSVGKQKWLQNLLSTVALSKEVNDFWVWKEDKAQVYSVKSAYDFILSRLISNSVDHFVDSELSKVWRCVAPPKVLTSSWRLLINRLPTREALARRGLFLDGLGTSCPFCKRECESVDHIFLTCPISLEVWHKIFDWLGGLSYLAFYL